MRNCAEVKEQISQRKHSIIICEADDTCLPDGTSWREISEMAQKTTGKHLVIVCGELVDAGLWAEAINLGVHDVLAKPFEKNEVANVIAFAARKHLH
jgi:DNA-binding NtrC family response regulator